MKAKITLLLLTVSAFLLCCGFVKNPSLNNLDEWIVKDMWNDGVCDFDWYMCRGTDSCGETSYDSTLALSKFKMNALQVVDYDSCISSLPDTPENMILKQDWELLKGEIVKQYGILSQYETLPIDKKGLDLGLFKQYKNHKNFKFIFKELQKLKLNCFQHLKRFPRIFS